METSQTPSGPTYAKFVPNERGGQWIEFDNFHFVKNKPLKQRGGSDSGKIIGHIWICNKRKKRFSSGGHSTHCHFSNIK